MRKERPWKDRKLLKEVTMSDGFKLTFWLYEWNDEVASKLKHRYCVRIRKLNPIGLPLLTEQIGVRIDNWEAFLDSVTRLKPEPLHEEPQPPKILRSILAVLEQVYKKEKPYDEAARIAAKSLQLSQKTIRHYCTADIGLKSKQLKKLLEYKEKLRTLLTEKFPEYEDKIKETLS